MGRLTTVVIGGFVSLGLCAGAQASTSVNEAYGQCKAEIKEKFGDATRVKLKGSKKYKGTLTVKVSVMPEGSERQRVLCQVTDDVLVLADKKGEPLS